MHEKFPALDDHYLLIYLSNISWSSSKAIENRISIVFTFETITEYIDIKTMITVPHGTYLQQKYSRQNDREGQGLEKVVPGLCADDIQGGIQTV